MSIKTAKLKLSIKAKILGILALILILSFLGYISIISYINRQVSAITQSATSQIYNFENKANKNLKNNILTKLLIEDVKVYANYINDELSEIQTANKKSIIPSDKLLQDKKKYTSRILSLLEVIEIEKDRPGFMFIINHQGKIIAVENNADKSPYAYHFKLNTNLLNSNNKLIIKKTEEILNSKTTDGIIKVKTIKAGNFFVLYSRINSINCTLIKVLPLDYLNSQVKQFAEKLYNFIVSINGNIISVYTKTNYIALGIFLLIIVIAFVIGSFLSQTISKPLNRLKEATKYIGKGNLIKKIKINTGDEIEELADNFNLMTRDLKDYINRLSKSISRRQAIEEEIKLAANIQLSSLPPPTPNFQINSIDLNAYIKPTKIVSGDFYDYFLIDDNNLFFAIGDVSGKSISAALFMMTTKLLMKRFALMKQSPDQILKNVNDTLALDNQTCMYSTIFCGILNKTSGELKYCNGGHTYPAVYNGNKFKYLETMENMLVGLTSKSEFKTETTTLLLGNMLFLYSDGVTECKNISNKMYSEEQLLKQLNIARRDNSQVLIDNIKNNILMFGKKAEQYDDITMLCVKLLPSEKNLK